VKVLKVRRTINGRTIPKAEYEHVYFDLAEDRQVTLLDGKFGNLAEGYMHTVFTTTNSGSYHLRVEVMVMARPASNNPGDVRPAEFDFETWYIAFYPAGKDEAS
jgi:hypothetical protein